ncbi:Carbohydrate family 9 binding domain-like [Tenacibaculum sp. MAR_2009_124]|uniref:DUF5916 domain-containing protein n=1 Tax=Tenacibaculum sp. MAR_2009_124 TaxID=1250059 RepID=UPI00089CCA05|nr:DUF5916 domain-containing protein [Tenacibaculum sp. MAR_2009_124]SEB82915.1 Carbohydrate family 9 binding domain-like [Tenacibaculum sp. MAR_2009_124]
MRNNFVFLSLVFLVIPRLSKAQTLNADRKKISAIRVSKAPKIDGKIDDDAWNKAEKASDFIMWRPDNGKPEPNTHKTKVKLVYDDKAIYVSAEMEAPDPSKIPAEFTNRDNIGNADFFLMTINPNDDGQNPFQFIVTSSGVQADAKVSNGNEDFNWSAVWDSSVRFTENAWIVEMKIPYRALRFANEPVQSWGINFHRRVQNLNAQFTWNHVDNQVGRWTQYDGLLENLKDIKPPTRLTLYPYASSTVISNKSENSFDWSVGMDIKYGITENFTLDATLIPDFGQAAFDNVVLNLGPFEQQFTEQRQFFTEGTELFTKGGLFYSRRIGGSPIDQFKVKDQITDDEEIIDSPNKVDMLNAVKISGRTKKGLGIGFFNAITDKTEATVKNKVTNETRTLVTNPFSNYNIIVLDQQFNQNSSVTLINTNVTRVGEFRDANTSGVLWHIEDKKSTYNIDGSFRMSHLSDDDTKPSAGYTFDTSIGKHAGNWRGEIGYNFENKDFDPNDFGIFFRNNRQRIYGFLGYRLLQPKGIFNNYGVNFYYNVNFLHNPGTYVGANGGLSFWSQTKKRFGFGGNLNFSTERKDFFEPRQGTLSGIYFKAPQRININHWGSTDYRKKFAVDYNWFYNFFRDNPKEGYGFRFAPRYRFNNRFSLVYGFRYSQTNRDQGYVRKISESYVDDNPQYTSIKDDIIFGERDWTTYNNTLTGKYSFSALSSLSLSFRHNWSKVPYYNNNFYSLDETNGNLVTSIYNEDHNRNFNSWNIDLNYVWQFAPGSQLIAFYRNSINPSDNFAPADIGFADNLSRLFEQDMQHTFSLRLVYFIDYNNLKNIL